MSHTENEMADQITTVHPTTSSVRIDVRIAGCGFLMGAADIVPGVSGGTVALILGIYERLVTAISRCNLEFLNLLRSRQWNRAATHVDLRFVVALGCGILTGIVGLASLMNYLLTQQTSLTFAAFSGMIIASSLLVARRVSRWRLQHIGALMIGILIALRLVTLPALQNPPDTLWYMFVCGMIGITAMILPGISGAFILLLLNRYHEITESIKGLTHGEISVSVILSLTVFAAGCVTGLLGFSRILRWLLASHHNGTMAMLCGFMIGSLYKLWPFQRDLTPEIEKFKHKTFTNYVPESLDSHVWSAVILSALGIGVVLALDAVAVHNAKRRREASTAANLAKSA
jgi:putative membrane protein